MRSPGTHPEKPRRPKVAGGWQAGQVSVPAHRICARGLLVFIGGRASVMTPKQTYSVVLARAKRGGLIDRVGLTIYYIAIWLGIAWSLFPFPSALFPPDYFVVSALAGPFGLLLLALAIFMWLKWRLL